MVIAIQVDTRTPLALPHTTSRLLRSMICDLYHDIYPWHHCDELSLTYMIKQLFLNKRPSQHKQVCLIEMLQVLYTDVFPRGKPPRHPMYRLMFMVQALHKQQHHKLNVQYNK